MLRRLYGKIIAAVSVGVVVLTAGGGIFGGGLAAMTVTADEPIADETVAGGLDDGVISGMISLVTSDRVNFRKEPSMEGEVMTILPAGADVSVTSLEPDGWDTVVIDNVTGYIKGEYLITREEYDKLPASKLELLEWGKAKGVVRIGADLKILDVRSGKVYYVRSFSNGNHADVEPITKEDTAIMKSTYRGSWSWDPRPVWVFTDGRVLAASINGMPHGGGVNGNNGMSGQVCLHFKGSTTHNGNKSYAAEMQGAVVEAWNSR